MGLLDNLYSEAKSVIDVATKTGSEYLKEQVKQQFVKQGPAPTGNLTGAQLASGERGATAPLPQSAAASRLQSFGSFGGIEITVPVLIGAGVVAYFMFRRRR
jgi:hypothetical protein